MIETNLVDFKSLEQDPTGQRRRELLKGVASLFAVACDRCTLEQIEIYDDVLVRLSEMVEAEARAAAAEKLAPLRRAPERIVRLFAQDEAIIVAGPVLTRSPVLKEGDLIAVAEARGTAHLGAIARRTNLSEQLSEVVVLRGDDEVRRAVAANPGARLGEGALERLVQQAMTDRTLAESLGERADTPDAVIQALVREAADEVRRVLQGRGLKAAEGRVDEAARHAGERMSNDYWIGLYDFETAWERAWSRGGASQVSEATLCRLAAEDRFADVVAAFAILADLHIEETKHWLVRTDTEPFLIIARALDLRFSTVQSLLMTGPWRHRLGQDQRRAALARFLEIDDRVARARISAWRQTRLAG
jgi:uncharacterized protein (DUF2336 family)